MRKMGGLWKRIPFTYAMMWIGSLALAGIPFFAGFYSKDIILESAWGAHSGVGQFAFWAGIAAAGFTALYSWRLIIMTFHGEPRMDEETWHHVHESPLSMLGPLAFLAVGAVFSGYLAYDYFVGESLTGFWRDSILILEQHQALEAAHHVPLWVKLAPLVIGVAGIGLAYIAYMFWTDIPRIAADRLRPVYLFLYNKWYFDELFDWLFVRPAFFIGKGLWKSGDGAVIDGVGPDGLAAATLNLARRAGRLQTGYVYHYAFAMLIGVAALVTWYLFLGAG